MFEELFSKPWTIDSYRAAPLVKERIRAAGVPALAGRKITPHVLRHTTACHLALAGVDINTIRAWLGHATLHTTNIYVEINLEMKARAVAFCDAAQPKPGRPWKEDKGIVAFLKSL